MDVAFYEAGIRSVGKGFRREEMV